MCTVKGHFQHGTSVPVPQIFIYFIVEHQTKAGRQQNTNMVKTRLNSIPFTTVDRHQQHHDNLLSADVIVDVQTYLQTAKTIISHF